MWVVEAPRCLQTCCANKQKELKLLTSTSRRLIIDSCGYGSKIPGNPKKRLVYILEK